MANRSMSATRVAEVNSFVGKTVERFDCSSTNSWSIYFTDGTKLEIETEATGIPNLYAIVPNTSAGDAKMRQFASAGSR